MQLSDILEKTGGLQSIARELNIGEADAARAASALAPAVLGGFRKQAESNPQGLEGLGGMLSQLGGGGLLDSVLSSTPTDTAPGNNVLGQIFGSKDVSRAVAQNAASQTGQDPSLLKKMLPMLAMLVAGYMAKQRAGGEMKLSPDGGAGLGGLLGGMLGGGQSTGQGTGDVAGALGGLLGMGGQRNPLDDILGRLGR
ncbi:MAG TPA: DUF937 domain-containing protein [Steroidobacteraceae bacterium]|nr:DUF937 domain-containing protein [Steroidobacteraceae bacterium]